MLKTLFFTVLTALLLALTGCKDNTVDVVDGIDPVSRSLAHVAPALHELANLPAEQRAARLRQAYPRLEQDVAYYLRTLRKLTPEQRVQRVEFLFGSADYVRAEDARGTMHEGQFRNQLVAKVYVTGAKDPLMVIVQCLNGTFIIPEELGRLQSLGSYVVQERFTIQRGEGLIHHVDFRTAIDVAERFDLPLYRGRTMVERNRISPQAARVMEPTTDEVQVTVYVVEGDIFDLREMRFYPSARRSK